MYKPGEGKKKPKTKKHQNPQPKTHTQTKKTPQLYKVDTAATDTVPGIA